MERTKEMFRFGVGIWTGALVYSVINLIMNANSYPQSKILTYNYIISGAAIVGLILNLIFLKRKKK
jgi:hypothetical protein